MATPQTLEPSESPREPVKLFRVLLLGTALAIPCAFWLQYAELVQREGLFAVESALPLPAVTGLLLLLIAHAVLGLFKAQRLFPRREILLVYIFLLITVPLASYGLAQQLMPHLTVGRYYENPSNNYGQVLSYLPRWIAPEDPGVIQALFRGGPGGLNFRAWVWPITRWMVFLTALFFFGFFLSLLVERQWAIAERLPFPLTTPALELTAAGPTRLIEHSLLRDPVLWAGMGWSIFYSGTAVLAALVPTFKPLYFGGKIGPLYFSYRPIVLGIAYLASTDLSLSIWIFELVKAGQKMAGELLGLGRLAGTNLPTSTTRFPYHDEQALGAFVFIALMSLGMARKHIFQIAGSVWRRDPADETSRIRHALLGLLGSGLAMAAWLLLSGFRVAGILLFILLILFVALTHGRIRAEAGPPVIWTVPGRPDLLMVSLFGSSSFSSGSLAQISVFGFLSQGYFPLLMATQLDSLKMARESQVRYRDLIGVLLAALLVGSFVGIWSLLHFWSAHGAESLARWPITGAHNSYRSAVSNLNHASEMDLYGLSAVGAGFLFTSLLALLRSLYWSWPLHPLGYAISQTASSHLWFMFLIAWAVKSAVMRYGGVRLFRRTVPFFFGLVFGQIVMLISSNLMNYFFAKHIYVSAF